MKESSNRDSANRDSGSENQPDPSEESTSSGDSETDDSADVESPSDVEQPGEEPDAPEEWSPSSDRPLAVVVRGTPERYSLHFIIIMVIDTRSNRENLIEVTPLAARDRDFIYQFNLDQPVEILKKAIRNEVKRHRSKSSPRDSRLVEEKFRTLFNQMMRAGNLGRKLQENNNEEIKQFMRRKVSDECFPGTNIDLEVKLSPWEPADVDEVEEEEEDEEEDQETEYLEVSPVVHPLSGGPIGELQPGDVFLVRVVGESITEIDPDHLQENDGNVYSKPLKARMVRMEQGETPQEITFYVEIDDELEGKGMVTRGVRVRSNEQLIQINKPITYQVLKAFLVIISVFFIISLSAIIFLY